MFSAAFILMFLYLLPFSKLLGNWLKFNCFCEIIDYLRVLFSYPSMVAGKN